MTESVLERIIIARVVNMVESITIAIPKALSIQTHRRRTQSRHHSPPEASYPPPPLKAYKAKTITDFSHRFEDQLLYPHICR